MPQTSTQIIRQYIANNISEFTKTVLSLNIGNADVFELSSGEEIVVAYADISITGSDRAKPQIRVFMDKTWASYQYAKREQKRFFLFTIFSKDIAMAKNIDNYDPRDYIVAIETNIDHETSRRDLRSMFDFLDHYIDQNGESDFVRCSHGEHQSGIYQASFIKIREDGADITQAFLDYITYFDSRPYMNSVTEMAFDEEEDREKPDSYNRIVFGAPGTGKSFRLLEDSRIFGKCMERVTFHPNYSYAQFVGTYKPVQGSEEDEIRYEYVPGPFMRVYVNAIMHPQEKYLLLIEEINRANVAAVFGDVFQLLDRQNGISEYEIATSDDIRKHLLKELCENKEWEQCADEEKEKCQSIKLPDNMYIWATMNSADQGVFPMDTAFKRRWDFEYIGVDDEASEVEAYVIPIGMGEHRKHVRWNDLRMKINDILLSDACKINEDKLLGPFFISKNMLDHALEDEEKFVKAFESKVLMYLFEDAVKMRPGNIFVGHSGRMIFSEICKAFEEKGEGLFGITDLEYIEDLEK